MLIHIALLLLLVALISLNEATGATSGEELLIGWQGETYKPKPVTSSASSGDAQIPLNANKILTNETGWVQILSWRPRAFVYHNFLSRDEVRHILNLASIQMKRSMVVGPNDTGVVDDIRTSAGTFLMRNQDSVITAIEQRLALWSHLPASFQEDMQVLRYGPTNKYGPHLDGLGRVMSVLIYLVEPEEGGETAFPESNGWLHPELGEATQGPFSPCAQGHVALKPKTGDALMFYDLKPNYKDADDDSTHTGCPVIKGVKWNAVKWIHGVPYNEEEYFKSLEQKIKPKMDPGLCNNLHEMCEQWALQGECEKNSGYMLGGDQVGSCRLACKACTPCQEGDTACIASNRIKGGFLAFDKDEFKGLL
ncbi:hypothetical protein CEUSTIGMA_g6575.t1 [Chlamydomonas eustigma]|uniref:Fe2OG dioxygenase domain-containing protein n=1 Tax=Chlamydomonas eustigma TaxID=1157962 RepID=A0A250X7U5_9CHLO|nr:hypothetical protein CEUSTIGMA_g6575.t1 [Chlamydomonas eustigma]|eukprot:GAX79135.1 hypothetical protein CEUSTIGMA_g6575.t1 [Chlamydomonas eustigma]